MFSEIARQKRKKNLQLATKTKDLLKGEAEAPTREEDVEIPLPSTPAGEAPLDEGDAEMSGLLLKEYARNMQLTDDEVWRQIRSGKLIARIENGFVYVYGDKAPKQFAADVLGDNQWQDNLKNLANVQLPSLPEWSPEHLVPSEQNFSVSNLPKVALLLDYLTQAKEENRKVLQLSQESIDKIAKLSENIIAMKDNVISEKQQIVETKETEIKDLKNQLQNEKKAAIKLRQEMEDLQMLTETLLKDDSPLP